MDVRSYQGIKVKNEHIKRRLGTAPIRDKLIESRLRRFGHGMSNETQESIQYLRVSFANERGGEGWQRETKEYMVIRDNVTKACGVTADMAQDTEKCGKRTQKAGSKQM